MLISAVLFLNQGDSDNIPHKDSHGRGVASTDFVTTDFNPLDSNKSNIENHRFGAFKHHYK
jgi:hypothetical protein